MTLLFLKAEGSYLSPATGSQKTFLSFPAAAEVQVFVPLSDDSCLVFLPLSAPCTLSCFLALANVARCVGRLFGNAFCSPGFPKVIHFHWSLRSVPYFSASLIFQKYFISTSLSEMLSISHSPAPVFEKCFCLGDIIKRISLCIHDC